ncbi:MAG: DUF1330 domain-containing protein [Pseudomonadota bacterium]
MAKGYWIAHVTVTDMEAWMRYVEGAREAFATHGARFLARGGAYEELETPMERERHVLIEFPSLAAAKDCYHSSGYQAARLHREGAGIASIVITEGLS